MKFTLRGVFNAGLLFVLILMVSSVVVSGETIMWVSNTHIDPNTGIDWDQPFIDVLEGAGYTVQRENDTMATTGGAPLSDDQIQALEAVDLIIMSRGCNSGDYLDAQGWNSISKPLINTTAYLSRDNRWKWFPTSTLLGDGNSGCPAYYAEKPDHPIFAGVPLDANNIVEVLDEFIGSGHTSLHNEFEAGDDGQIIASVGETGTVAIVYWPTDAFFHPAGDQFAGGPRLLFQCGARESTAGVPEHGQGMYNLTPEGEKMFLNAVAFMLGKEANVAEKPTAPADFVLAQNYPNPFNPQTTISFYLPTATAVSLRVYDVTGREVNKPADAQFAAGAHQVVWNGRDASGRSLESGVYFYKLEAGTFQQTRKMTLIK